MDTISRSEVRNYATAAGFLVLAMILLECFVCQIVPSLSLQQAGPVTFFGALILMLAGVILAVEKQRDMTAIAFLMTGLVIAFSGLQPVQTVLPYYVTLISGVFLLILALILLTAKDRIKYLLCIPLILIALYWILTSVAGAGTLTMILSITAAVISLYFVVATACERITLPLGDLLRSDTKTDFKSAGSVLGYLLLDMIFILWAVSYFTGWGVVLSAENVAALEQTIGSMLIFVGVLLWAVGKMKFTPFMFLIMGIPALLGSQVAAVEMLYPFALMIIFIGVMAVLRSDARVMPAIMFILSGTSILLFIILGSSHIAPLQGLLNIIQALIAVYLAFAVFNQNKKLPLF